MNILFVTDHYTPTVNGIVRHIVSIKQELKKRGHTIYIVAPPTRKKIEKEPNVFRLPAAIPFPLKKGDLFTLPFDPRIENKLLKTPIDIVHSHLLLTGFMGIRIAQKKNIPTVVTLHTLWRHYIDWMVPWGEKKIKYRISDWAARNYFNQYDSIIAPSSKAIDALLEAKVKTPVHLIYNGIDIKTFKKAKTMDLSKLTSATKTKRPTIIMTGRIDKGKNADLAIRAIYKLKKQIPEVLFIMVGDGSEREKIESLLNKYNLKNNVIITGFVDQSMIASLNKSADVALFTSDTDTLPTVLIEAAASGKPVVSVYDKAVVDIVRHEKNGYLVPKDTQAIADALQRLLTNQNLRKQYGIKSESIASDFSITKNAIQLEKLYKELTDKNKIPQNRGFFSFLTTKKW